MFSRKNKRLIRKGYRWKEQNIYIVKTSSIETSNYHSKIKNYKRIGIFQTKEVERRRYTKGIRRRKV